MEICVCVYVLLDIYNNLAVQEVFFFVKKIWKICKNLSGSRSINFFSEEHIYQAVHTAENYRDHSNYLCILLLRLFLYDFFSDQ